jgi:histidyl-tRNA synthetase
MRITNLKEKKKNIKRLADYTADYYGFDFIEISEKKHSGNNDELVEKEKVNILKTILKKEGGKKISGTKLFFYNQPILKLAGKNDDKIILDIVNLESAVAEALIIKTAIKILEDEGYSNISIQLNSIGDKESQKGFKKELTEYYREHRDELKTIEKKKITVNPFEIFYSNKEYLKELNINAPTPIDNLSQASLDHFKKVTEYIDNFGIEYVINPTMVGEKRYFSKIIFKIFATDPKTKEQTEVGFGGRYDELAGETLKKKKISAVGLHLSFTQKNKQSLKLKENDVNIHLLKIGSTAELKFLEIVDIFKKMNIPLQFSLSEKKISKQLERAKKENADKIIILGEREAKTGKVILRNAGDSSQKEIKIKDLEKYVKKIGR